MNKVIRWGLAAGLAAALALFGSAQAQSATGSSGSGTSGSRGDTGGAPPGGGDRSTTTSPTPQGGAPGSSSDPGRAGATTDTTGRATGASGAAGSEASGRQAAAGGKVDKGLQEKLEKIHAANDAEVHLSQMAAQQAQSPEVKQFAQQMQTDHQGLGDKLEQVAQSAGITSLEGKAYQKEHERAMKDNEKLQSKTGADFDKEFMSRIVKDHEKSVKETESAAKDARKANQTELASFLEKASSGMKGHLDHAKQLRASVDRGGGEQMRQGRRPTGGTGTGAPESGAQPGTSGSRGDTGGPAPGGGDRSTTTSPTPGGGAPGSSSDPGQQQRPRQ